MMMHSARCLVEYFIRLGDPTNSRSHYTLSYYNSAKKWGENPQSGRLASETSPYSIVHKVRLSGWQQNFPLPEQRDFPPLFPLVCSETQDLSRSPIYLITLIWRTEKRFTFFPAHLLKALGAGHWFHGNKIQICQTASRVFFWRQLHGHLQWPL